MLAKVVDHANGGYGAGDGEGVGMVGTIAVVPPVGGASPLLLAPSFPHPSSPNRNIPPPGIADSQNRGLQNSPTHRLIFVT